MSSTYNINRILLRIFWLAVLLFGLAHFQALASGPQTVFRLNDSYGNPVAWLNDIGEFYLTGSLNLHCETITLTGDDEWYVKNGSTVVCKIALSGNYRGQMFVLGDSVGTDTNLTAACMYIKDPYDSSKVIFKITNAGVLNLKGSSSVYLKPNTPIPRADYLTPWNITARSISPTFPTPCYWADLPDPKNEPESVLGGLSAMELESMFVFRPNMKWDNTNDGTGITGALYGSMAANQNGGDWSRATFNGSGAMYVYGDDSGGYQAGQSTFNRVNGGWGSPGTDKGPKNQFFIGQFQGPKAVFARIKDLIPGKYGTMKGKDDSGDSRGKNLGWYQNRYQVDTKSSSGDSHSGGRPCINANLMAAGALYLNGTYYFSSWEDILLDGSKIDNNMGWGNPWLAGIFCVQNIDTCPSQTDTWYGNEWENDDARQASVLSWNQTQSNRYVRVHSNDTDPTGNNIATMIATNAIWTNHRFTCPSFIQFGKGYEDYTEPDLTAPVSAYFDYIPPNATYHVQCVYALSTNLDWWREDDLYLGRCPVGLSAGQADQWGTWQYFTGLDQDGNPIWNNDVTMAKSVLHSAGDIGHPHVAYEPNSKLYIMGTFNNNNDPTYCRTANQGFIYVARKPWGPWRKVFTMDYNGLQNRAAQDARGQGGAGYSIHIMSNRDWIDSLGINPTTGCGTLKFWIQTGGFWNQSFMYERTGDPISNVTNPIISTKGLDEWIPWDERFKQMYWTLCFQQIELKISQDFPGSMTPAAAKVTVPSLRSEGKFKYDHWGWRLTFNGDGSIGSEFKLDPIWVGHQFMVGPNDIKVQKLGRYYITGNANEHKVALVDAEGLNMGQIVASVKISPTNTENAEKPVFWAADNVSEDGFIYQSLSNPVTLNANHRYYLLSQEGLTTSQSDPPVNTRFSAAENCVHGNCRSTSDTDHYAGFRFKTGPLGMRITHVMRLKGMYSGDNSVLIEKANNDSVLFVNEPFSDPGHKTQTPLLDQKVYETNTIKIGDTDFVWAKVELAKPLDLDPLTEYYIGMKVNARIDASHGDSYYDLGSLDPPTYPTVYDSMTKMRFNPNVLQFIHPAKRLGDGSWYSARSSIRPNVSDGQTHDDGVGVVPVVFGPVNFLCVIPDRFEGYRQPVNASNKDMGDFVTMPVFKRPTSSTIDYSVVSAAYCPKNGKYGEKHLDTDLFNESGWSNLGQRFYPCGPPNSTFGPLNLEFTDGTNTEQMLTGDVTSDFVSSYQSSDGNGNKWQIKKNSTATAASQKGYLGMQINIGNKDLALKQVYRYFESGNPQPHEVMLCRSRGCFYKKPDPNTSEDIIGIGTIYPPSSLPGWGWTTLNKPPIPIATPSVPPTTRALDYTINSGTGQKNHPEDWLKAGMTYFIGSWEDGTLDDRSYGIPDDFSRLTTGGSVNIIGPVRADNDVNNNPDTSSSHIKTIEMSSTVDFGANPTTNPNAYDPAYLYPYGYGPLNMIYEKGGAGSMNLIDHIGAVTAGGDYKGWRGVKIKTGYRPLMVTALGRWKMSGNQKLHQVMIQKVKPGPLDSGEVRSAVVASAIVNANDDATANNGYNFAPLEQPVVLEPLTEYYVMSYEDNANGGDSYVGTAALAYNADPNPNPSLATNTDAQKLYYYDGGWPDAITSNGTEFQLDANYQYLMTGDGIYSQVNSAFGGLVNLRIQ